MKALFTALALTFALASCDKDSDNEKTVAPADTATTRQMHFSVASTGAWDSSAVWLQIDSVNLPTRYDASTLVYDSSGAMNWQMDTVLKIGQWVKLTRYNGASQEIQHSTVLQMKNGGKVERNMEQSGLGKVTIATGGFQIQ